MADPERHTKPFDDFDLRVEVQDSGDVWVIFVRSGDPKVTLSVDDLSEVVAFTETHGQVTVRCPE